MTNPFANSFPVAAPSDAHWTDTVVTQGHVDYCAANGHAEWAIDGEIQPRCPRCGVVTAEAEAEAEADDYAECEECGQPIDYCQGHGSPLIEEWEAYSIFNDYLDECYEIVKLGGLSFMPSAIMRELDWPAYREAFLNYVDFMGIRIKGY